MKDQACRTNKIVKEPIKRKTTFASSNILYFWIPIPKHKVYQMPAQKVRFTNDRGLTLVGKIEFPLTHEADAFAIFAHVFTGNKNLSAARHISRSLTLNGFAVLRFDFSGLGESEGNFSDTNFTTNVNDIKAAAQFLTENYQAPKIIVGHSLGGAASIYAAKVIESIKAVATIGAPSEPEHVTHLFGCKLEDIERDGQAEITIGGRPFTIKRQFIEDLQAKDMDQCVQDLRKALLILHSPQDRVVEIENAAKIYHAAFHPKSFVTLNEADHMLTAKDDAFYTGNVIASWVKRYIEIPEDDIPKSSQKVTVSLKSDAYTTEIMAGKHGLLADQSEKHGGNDFGPSPYELLSASLGACVAMSLQSYAEDQEWDVEEIQVNLSFDRAYQEDIKNITDPATQIKEITGSIELRGALSEEQKNALLQMAKNSPVCKSLSQCININIL